MAQPGPPALSAEEGAASRAGWERQTVEKAAGDRSAALDAIARLLTEQPRFDSWAVRGRRTVPVDDRAAGHADTSDARRG